MPNRDSMPRRAIQSVLDISSSKFSCSAVTLSQGLCRYSQDITPLIPNMAPLANKSTVIQVSKYFCCSVFLLSLFGNPLINSMCFYLALVKFDHSFVPYEILE